ncbi:MAG TPA: DUF998 domain-containing protein [Euzebyales bacterium]|nr:DUF998 domain-containing protein [Euzebyales bacterium]
MARAAFLASTSAVVALHVVRADLDPVRRRLSEYAIGPVGGLMTAAFVLLGLGLYALSRAVRSVDATTPGMRVFRALLGVAAIGMTVSAVFETRPVTPPGWREILHSRASALAFVALIAAALWTATVARDALAWGTSRSAADVVTAVATLGAVIGPLAHDGPWAGMVQRLSYVAVLGWLLLTAAATARTPTISR